MGTQECPLHASSHHSCDTSIQSPAHHPSSMRAAQPPQHLVEGMLPEWKVCHRTPDLSIVVTPCTLLQGDPVFGELMENITAVIQYFNAQVEQARGFGGWDWSVEKVLDVIKGGTPAPRQAPCSPSSGLDGLKVTILL